MDEVNGISHLLSNSSDVDYYTVINNVIHLEQFGRVCLVFGVLPFGKNFHNFILHMWYLDVDLSLS